MKKGQATRARIVAEASRMASVRGLGAVSLNDLAEAVGLSKSGVFKHFKDRDDLHLAVIQATVERFLTFVWTPALKYPPGRERVAFILNRWLDWSQSEAGPGGCPFVQASVEFDDQPGPVRDYMRQINARWRRTLAGELAALGRPAPEKVQQAIYEIQSFVMGFNQQCRLLDDENARAMASAALAGVLDRLSLEPLAA